MRPGAARRRAEAARAGRRRVAQCDERGVMGIAATLRDYLDRHSVRYELLRHTETKSTARTAEAGHVPGDRVAKPAVIEDADRHTVAGIPATRRTDFTEPHRKFRGPVAPPTPA